ncbi:MAG: universal stress protein [Desulfobacterales bacterium]
MADNQGYRRILCATDLSSNADAAFEHAARIAHLSGDSFVTMIHALEKIPPNAELYVSTLLGFGSLKEFRNKDREQIVRAIRSRIERFCDDVVRQIPECRRIVDSVIIEEGMPEDLILTWVKKMEADLVVIGAEGHTAFLGTNFGSTTRKVLKKCRKPVLVVPATTRR